MTISLHSGRTRRTYLVISLPSLSLPPKSMLGSCFYIEKLYTFTREISTNRRIFKLVLLRFDFLKGKMEKLTLKVTEISGGHRNSIVLSCPTQPRPSPLIGTGYFPWSLHLRINVLVIQCPRRWTVRVHLNYVQPSTHLDGKLLCSPAVIWKQKEELQSMHSSISHSNERHSHVPYPDYKRFWILQTTCLKYQFRWHNVPCCVRDIIPNRILKIPQHSANPNCH